MKILIFGLPGSGKSTLAEPFAELINGIWINADQVRTHYDDWDFTPEGRMRQAMRMKFLADGVVRAGKTAIADFVCPTEAARVEFGPDYTVWMDTIAEGLLPLLENLFLRFIMKKGENKGTNLYASECESMMNVDNILQ